MNANRKCILRLEALESREVPAVVRHMSGLNLVSQSGNDFMLWLSPDTTNNASSVALKGSLSVKYTFSGKELSLARSNAGHTLTEEIRLREDDSPYFWDENIRVTYASYKFSIPAGDNERQMFYTPPTWEITVAPFLGTVEGDEAEFYGWLNDPNKVANHTSGEIEMGLPPAGTTFTGGIAVNKHVEGTDGVGYEDKEALAFANPALPALAPNMQQYRVLSFDSPNGNDLIATAANTTGYSLLAASSNSLVWDNALQDSVIPNTTTFTTAYTVGAQIAGAWSGGETSWVVRDATGTKTFYLTGYSYTKVPANFVGLADGQSASVSAGSIQEGVDALWLTFETDGESVGFLILGANGSTITGRVWDDTTQNGIQDGGEIGRANVQVQLLDVNLNVVAITFTDSSGNYTFSNVVAGQYRVRVIPPTNNTFAPKDVGTNDAIDSAFDEFGYGDIISTNGRSNHDLDAGLWFSLVTTEA